MNNNLLMGIMGSLIAGITLILAPYIWRYINKRKENRKNQKAVKNILESYKD